MAAEKDLAYSPDYAVPPGETLLETIEALGMTQADLAARTGRTLKTINEIVKGKAPIRPDTALQLERALGVPASFWNNRERNYREVMARREERERLKGQGKWLRELPVRSMVMLGWVSEYRDRVRQLQELLNFFGVASPDQWHGLWSGGEIAFRKSAAFRSNPGAVAAWLRKGEVDANRLRYAPYDESKFRAALSSIRALTVESPEVFQPELVRLCAEAGVAVIFTPELSGTRVNGATRWLSPDKALIQLSLRYKTNDHLWFTFFHEAGHILLHGKREVFLEGEKSEDGKEKEADRFASNVLIPAGEYRKFVERGLRNQGEIRRFAERLGIAPGIVVGRLQHDEIIPQSYFNDLKIRLAWERQSA
ncbi:MAG: plasmid maintenance system antidote protein [Deltaproteobacteria bacterium CSP1-8]|nr:MAG: plasmid maintenance system antidote protein [Deltaproteobacteria bacterium CSP1-8]